MWLGIFLAGIMVVILQMYRVKGAIIMGILLVSIISWPRPTSVTNFPYTPVGNAAFDFFKKVVTFHPIGKILNVQRWDISSYGGQFGLAFITFLYVDILDATGTLYSMARFAGAIDPVTQDFENSTIAYSVDAIGISIGALMGCPPVTAYIESGAGIFRRWRHWLNCDHDWSLLLHLHLFRSNLRVHSTMGHWSGPCHCRFTSSFIRS
jgi:adenine/guanine/hypoxanthine permease